MSYEYDLYLIEHKTNVMRAFSWLEENVFTVGNDLGIDAFVFDPVAHSISRHDNTKYSIEEYNAYDRYFYEDPDDPDKRDHSIRQLNKAWLHHIHNNKHHWQHWVLINDDPGLGLEALPMDRKYVVEMICDWWSFSWADGNLHEIFDWYDVNRDYIFLHDDTRELVENILDAMKRKLDASDDDI